MCDHCGCRDEPAIAELSADHEAILDLAWRVAEARRTGDDAVADLHALAARLALHVAVEEDRLYPLLAEVGRLADDVRVALELEHRELDAALADGGFDRRAFYALAAHIEHEETELFPAAMLSFDDEEWESLAGGELTTETPPTP
jgi:hemerythrin-like domain-containing protein